MKVRVIEEKCIRCGMCAEIAPEVFTVPEDSEAKVAAQPDSQNAEAAKDAAESCPTEAIAIE